ncbi:VOC family protein [Halobacterium yunchengense]|uniref:VOC family protein n=1 Tax=Halobacterium yunchengense TaxID=3108497 RepID=UPI003009F594
MTAPGDTALPSATRVGRVALRVPDLAEAVAFYREVVGLRVIDRTPSRATLGAGGDALLVLDAAPDEPERPADAAGLYHAAFRVPSRSALGDALGRVREQWTLQGAADHLVSEAVYLADPAGNGVEIYRDRPREEWPRTPDGRPRIGTEPLDVEGVVAAAAGGTDAPAGTDVGHVHLEVSSLPAARAFYVDALGFDVVLSARGALFVAAGGYHHHVGLNTWRGRTAPAGGRGLAWTEFVLPDADALAAVRRRTEAAGYAVSPTDAGFVARDDDAIAVRLRAGD